MFVACTPRYGLGMLKLFRRSGFSARDCVVAGTALALILVAFQFALFLGWRPLYFREYVLAAAVSAGAWLVSRAAPRTVLVIVAVVVAVPFIWGHAGTEVRLLSLAIAGFRAATFGSPIRFVVPITALSALFAVSPTIAIGRIMKLSDRPQEMVMLLSWMADPSQTVTLILGLTAVLALGFTIMRLHLAADGLAAQNDRLRLLQESERERVSQEVRTAIARDIHDGVAHHVTAMVVQAQAAVSVCDQAPERLADVVRSIASEGNDALAAMRRAVQIMRSDTQHGMGAPGTFESAVETFADRLRVSGRQVRVAGEFSPADDEAKITLLWILQESLTNVLLHSDAPHVGVQFSLEQERVRMVVEDAGPSAAHTRMASGGHGVRGMTERASMAGGVSSAGPRSGGGWSVCVDVPAFQGARP